MPGVFVQAAADAGPQPVILIVGDSLSAGYGISVDTTWVALLQKRLSREGYGYRVVNASVSGETTGGARTRLGRALELHKPALVILELGGNDGLRGLPLKQVQGNFAAMLEQVRAAKAQSVLIAMRIPSNYGPAYTERFHAIYGELAKIYSVPVVDGFMESVALNDKLMQADGIHPNAQAQPILLDVIWPTLERQLKK
ncbi:acyl-CoA thioesterase-1 [Povalibacter uvarum]|uniref:Acyl-CoA thioesterase-1 n=1 Tax=Povalibacter uvarum TaxID=732238 RepID=A0A841HJK0_9GAMM|nr:arylesterase [Povalibacter uvarum]MBB6092976.1 acyl-CoA thioesterase-1 [Povalibacter uvarum]